MEPAKVIPFELPKKPRIKEKEPLPDQRKVVVLPFKAVFDKRLTHGALQALAALCAYCNRAGITWVSQKRLAEELEISQQAYSKQFRQLVKCGYVEVVKKSYMGQRSATTRVIYDPSITAEDAIAMVSSKEDSRPPWMIEEQRREMEQPKTDPEGQKRIARMISEALKQPNKPKEYTMPKSGETATVKKMKQEIENTKKRRSTNNPQVVTQPPKTTQLQQPPGCNSSPLTNNLQVVSNDNLQVVLNTNNEHIVENIYKVKHSYKQLKKSEMERLLSVMTIEQLDEAMDTLMPLFKAEGIEPSSRVLMDSILQLHMAGT